MSKRPQIDPDLCYLLGISTISTDSPLISVSSGDDHVIETFIKTAIGRLGIDPKKISVEESGAVKSAGFYNSILKKKLLHLLSERDRIFKYFNNYSGSYYAGIFDARGGIDRKGIFLKHLDPVDVIMLERLGVRVSGRGVFRMRTPSKFAELVRPFSAKFKYLEQQNSTG